MATDITTAVGDFVIQRGKVGRVISPEFEATAGKSDPIEILISEIPAGLFCASLVIQELEKNDRAAPLGLPFLPLFRLDGSQSEATESEITPLLDSESPVRKLMSEGGRSESVKSATDPNPFSTLNLLVVNYPNVPSA